MTSATAREFDRNTTEREFAEFLDWVREHPEERDALVQLLDERSPLYQGRAANQVIRMRGYILAAFQRTGLPEAALPFVAEELQTGQHAYSVAAAAKAVRGLPQPIADLTPLVLKAIQNIAPSDDSVSFDDYLIEWPLTNPTTALQELFETLGWMGASARSALPFMDELLEQSLQRFPDSLAPTIRAARDRIAAVAEPPLPKPCCSFVSLGPAQAAPAKVVAPVSLDGVIFQDQDGRSFGFQEFFQGKPAVVVFFYTRCDNPEKCSLTIAKLAQLQAGIELRGLSGRVRTAAITYDPAFDLPQRLRAYGENRSVVFNRDNRMLRATEGFDSLQRYFQLGVNFVGTTVNHHRIELYVLNANGTVNHSLGRLQWHPDEVLEIVSAAVESK